MTANDINNKVISGERGFFNEIKAEDILHDYR